VSPPKDRRDREIVAIAWGRILRAAREAAGMSQETLATRAHLDRTYPSLLERGRRTPTLTSLFAISRALNVHPSALVERTWLAYRAGCAGAHLPEGAPPPPNPPAAPERVLGTADED